MPEENEKSETATPKFALDMKMLIIFGLIIIVAVFATTIIAIKFVAPTTTESTTKNNTSAEVATGSILTVGEDIMTNLADKETDRYIKFKLALEVSDAKLVAKDKAKELEAPIRHEVLLVLRKKTAADLQGSDGFTKLAKELKDDLNKNVLKGKLLHVYISDLVVQ